MLKQKQPNKWSCLPTAFAIVLGEPVDNIIKQIGHDGSEIIRPELGEPQCRKGFHIQECIKVALKYGIGVIHIDRYPSTIVNDTIVDAEYCYGNDLDLIIELMEKYDGVLLGKSFNKPHAVAWSYDKKLIIDPKTGESYEYKHFYIETFLMFRDLR